MFDEPSSQDVQSFQDTSESPDTLLGRFRRELARGPAVIENFCSIGHQTTVPFRIGDQHRVPHALRLIVAKCLAPIASLRTKRYSTAQGLKLDLTAFLNGRMPSPAVHLLLACFVCRQRNQRPQRSTYGRQIPGRNPGSDQSLYCLPAK